MADSKVSQSSNFGCASERNLAIMIADPSDLIRGKKLNPASAEHSLNALDRYYLRDTDQIEAEEPAEPLVPPVITAQ
jgi:pilus biogenesis lipoprotein CpaD